MPLTAGDIHDVKVKTMVRLQPGGGVKNRFLVSFMVREAGPFELTFDEQDYDPVRVKAEMVKKALQIVDIEDFTG